MTVNEAIEVLKYLSESIKIGGGKSLIYTRDAEAIDTVLSHINTPNKTGLDDNLLEKGIDQPDNQDVLSYKKDRLYTAEDMQAFAEFLIGRNTEWITELERNETAKTLIELWEQEMRKKED